MGESGTWDWRWYDGDITLEYCLNGTLVGISDGIYI
jgi:hypothetical protein